MPFVKTVRTGSNEEPVYRNESIDEYLDKSRHAAARWANTMLTKPADQWCILDSETTGLRSADQVVQISVIDGAGNPLINNQLIKPTVPIPADVTAIHGIDMSHVASAPTFEQFLPQLRQAVNGKTLVIFNADFDTRIIAQSGMAFGISEPGLDVREICCAMKWYSQFVGDFQRGQFKWKKLPGGDHSSLGDCQATLGVLKRMAEAYRPGMEMTNG